MNIIKLLETNFKGLSGQDLSGANINDADLSYAELSYANLTEVSLISADLTNANLTGVDLTNADLTSANLTCTNLTGANLTNANLTCTNLTGANLTNTNLTDANLTNTNLTGVKLAGAKLPKEVCRTMMSIYRITRKDGFDSGAFKSAIVVAESLQEAKRIHPDGYHLWRKNVGWAQKAPKTLRSFPNLTWVCPANVLAELVGETALYLPGSVILSTFTDD